MEDNIERRISRDFLGSTTLNNTRYYSSLGNYKTVSTTYFDTLAKHVPDGWEIERRSIWYTVRPQGAELIKYGFKIHISLLSETCEACLQTIVPVLIEHRAKFKMLVDAKLHDYFNSQACGRSASGKFITIYPDDLEKFKAVLQDLHAVTTGFKGPYILSDMAYRDSKCLFYRYGSFLSNTTHNIVGEKNPTLIGDTNPTPDLRTPYFQLPEGVVDPFKKAQEYPESSLLNNRYEVTEAITTNSPKGGVYLAIDKRTNEKVVIKEARPLVNRKKESNTDAIDGLKHEEHVLKRLESTGFAPRVIESFQEWEHFFLVIEFIDYWSLGVMGELQNSSIILKEDVTEAHRKEYCSKILTLTNHLLDAVSSIHAAGIVIGDLAPQNILYHTKNLDVRFIDFEGAYDQKEDKFYGSIHTRGFSSSLDRMPTFADDYAALGAVLIHMIFPVCHFFPLYPNGKLPFIEAVAKNNQLPPELIELIKTLSADLREARSMVNRIQSNLDAIVTSTPPAKPKRTTNLDSVVLEIIQNIMGSLNSVEGTLFPADYRLFNTNPLSVAYGATGVCSLLYEYQGALPETIKEQLLDLAGKMTNDTYPPGLYIGASGIAWQLYTFGFKQEALWIINSVYESPLLGESGDLFYGAAGWGLASLFFYEATGRHHFLEKALEALKTLQRLLQHNGEYYYYENITGATYSGLMHGSAGIALFVLRLYEHTQDPDHANLAKSLLNFELSMAEVMDDRVVWRKNYNKTTNYPYLRFGSTGIGMVALRFYTTLQEDRYLRWAEKIADALQHNHTLQPGLFLGMAGIGTFFLDLYQVTRQERHLTEAHAVAQRIILYTVPTEHGISFPGEELLRLSNDYGTGAAGIGSFLHRLSKQGEGEPLFLGKVMDASKLLESQ